MKPEDGTYVEVYWNLHKHTYSVRNKRTGRVVFHGSSFQLEDAKFAVQQGGRERVLREGRKNVHAFVRGYFYDRGHYTECSELVTYNPYKYENFVVKDNETAIYESKRVYLTKSDYATPVILAQKGN